MENQLKQLISVSVKENNTTSRDILRLVLGQIQTESATKLLSEDQKLSIVRKLIKSNEITLAAMAETQKENWNQEWQDNANKLNQEIELLKFLLPQTWTVEQLSDFFAYHKEVVRAAKTEGAAIGVAMKLLKTAGAVVNSSDVKEIVIQIRLSV